MGPHRETHCHPWPPVVARRYRRATAEPSARTRSSSHWTITLSYAGPPAEAGRFGSLRWPRELGRDTRRASRHCCPGSAFTFHTRSRVRSRIEQYGHPCPVASPTAPNRPPLDPRHQWPQVAYPAASHSVRRQCRPGRSPPAGPGRTRRSGGTCSSARTARSARPRSLHARASGRPWDRVRRLPGCPAPRRTRVLDAPSSSTCTGRGSRPAMVTRRIERIRRSRAYTPSHRLRSADRSTGDKTTHGAATAVTSSCTR